jgi:hypothetical protein
MGFGTCLDSVTKRIISMLAGDQILAIEPVMVQLSIALPSYAMLYSLDTDSILK